MLFAVLAFGAIVLTYTMFQSRSSMLGFPCLMFWAVLGGYCYQQSTATWDIYYLLFFTSFGMAIFSAFAAYGLRTKQEEIRSGDGFIDEVKDENYKDEKSIDEELPSKRSRDIRERADRRRKRWK